MLMIMYCESVIDTKYIMYLSHSRDRLSHSQVHIMNTGLGIFNTLHITPVYNFKTVRFWC